MSVTAACRARSFVAFTLLAAALLVLAAGVLESAFAQTGPFGLPRPSASTQPDGIVGWILTKQAQFYRQFSGLIRAAKADGSAVWSLLGVSFLYGVFHAAGPGHGKAVISSYVVANEETWTRGVVLSFASALLQAVVAVAIVGVAAALLHASAAAMKRTTDVIETVSYALIMVIGLRLLWVKGRAFVGTLRNLMARAVAAAADGQHSHHAHDHHRNPHAHHAHGDSAHSHHRHAHAEDASAWGHAHAPEPEELAGPGGWKRGLSAIVAVGLRPCSGAIIVLVFALAQGLFWAGVVATFVMGLGTAVTVALIAALAVSAKALARRLASARSGYGTLAMRGIEVAAALLITAFGALLLAGYMVSERIIGV